MKTLQRLILGSLAAATSCFAMIGAVQAAEPVIAYAVPADTPGNQAFGGVLGMDFEVANPIILTRLGVFDDSSDGLNLPILVRLWDRSDPTAPQLLVELEFSPEDAGTLVGGSRFKPLPSPLRLEVGFQGTISAEGYGAGERLRNTLGNLANRNWTVNDGNGSLLFVGGSRYGVVNGEYPDVVDEGPADRYCAGTFEFETTPPLSPGAPTGLRIEPANGTIALAWAAVSAPIPAATYEVWRADAPEAAFVKIAAGPDLQFADTGLVNGQVYCYRVRGIGAAGQTGIDSARACAAPFELPATQHVAYAVQAGLAGTQAFDGVLGMDFEVDNAVLVTHLGVFDDGSDGLARTLTARLWDRSDPQAPTELASLEFTTEDPGTLVRGTRFKSLPSPVRLEPGFQGTITAENYGAGERLYNPGGNPSITRPWTLDGGQGSLRFTGSGRYSVTQGEYPATPDGGAPDRYGTASFQFQTTALVTPGVPAVSLARGDLALLLSWPAVTQPAPATRYRVLRSTGEADPVQVGDVTGTAYTDTAVTKGTEYCYSVVAVSDSGQVSRPSTRTCLVAEAREPGVAYVVEAGTIGNQSFGGALGMDFDVVRAIQITRLGVFDDSSDGIFLPINARLYNRDTREVLASAAFNTDAPGELIEGSRFKDLAQPLVLPPGFHGTIVTSGYGGDERNGNNGIAGRSVFTGGGSIAFVGAGRWGTEANDFPGTVDGGPANRYAAGTFFFEPAPEPPTLGISRSGSRIKLIWTGGGTLESATSVTGPWTGMPGAASGVELETAGTTGYFRVRQ